MADRGRYRGGTFTDVTLVEEETGRIGIVKVPPTPGDFALPPEIREFERASTTAVCADVGPLLAGYLEPLQFAVSALGLAQMHVMGSSGAVFGIAEGLRMPAMALQSGSAPGVIAAALAGKELGLPNLSIRSFPTRVAPVPGGLGARRVWRVLGHEAHAAVCCGAA